jgi:hypothetical protein
MLWLCKTWAAISIEQPLKTTKLAVTTTSPEEEKQWGEVRHPFLSHSDTFQEKEKGRRLG